MEIPQLTEHYNKNRQRLVKRTTFRVGSSAAAEDIVQTAYERALRHLKAFRGEDKFFDRWFTTIVNNSLREYQNNEKGYSHREEDEETSLDVPHYPSRVMAEINRMIDERSVDHQEVLKMYFQQEYTATDISHITQHSYAKVHQIILRFRNELKEIYKE